MKQQVNLGLWHRLSQLVIGLIVLACLLGLGFCYLPVFQQNARMRKKILELETQVKTERAIQTRYQTAIASMRDPKTVERMARQKLGFAKPGETIIFFHPAQEPVVAQPVR